MTNRLPSLEVLAALSVFAGMTGCEAQSGVTSGSDGAPVRYVPTGVAADFAGDNLAAAGVATAAENDPITRASDIRVSVAQGRARLSGFVESAAVKLRAGLLAAETGGIAAVDNRLILRYHAGIADDPIGAARAHL